MAPQFTESVRDALERAFHLAQESNHTEVNENHLLHAFFEALLRGEIKNEAYVTLILSKEKNGNPIHFKVGAQS